MWGDFVHHTMITQLIVDNGGLFNSWQPYADLTTLTYHFGFHSDAAVFHWVTGLSSIQAVLWTGQLINVLAVIALYPLAVKLGRSRWAGVIAVIVAGLLAPMPMFYVNWGRYTQLTGQVTLIASVYLTWVVLEYDRIDWKSILLCVVALTGTALTHYRLLIFNILFFLPAFLILYHKGNFRKLVTRTIFIGAGSGLLFLPWFIHIFSGKILAYFGYQITTLPKSLTGVDLESNQIGSLSAYLPTVLWLLLALVIAWAVWKREKGAELVGLWWGLIILAANPNWVNLPGVGALTNFAVFIAIYIPAAVLLGGAAGWLIEDASKLNTWFDRLPNLIGRNDLINKYGKGIISSVILVLLLGICVRQARLRLYDVHPMDSAMVTYPDLRAAQWIQANTPADSRFLVNSFFAYNNTVIVGADAGWWLPLTANRMTTLPPMNYGTEAGPTPDYRQNINKLTSQINTQGITSLEVIQMLIDRDVSYVYIGQRQGHVNYGGPVLEPDQLLASASFLPVYHQDQVWIFEVKK